MSKNTPGKGTEYEVHVPAYFALRLNQHKNVKNFILQSNVPNFENLDDVVISVEMEDGRMYNYAFQLKHKEKKHKTLKPANFTANGDFNLEKYCNAFKELSDTNKQYSFVLYSNINFDDAKKGDVGNFIMADANYQDPYFNPSFFNESTGPKGMYEFHVKASFQGTQDLTKQDFEDFFSKFYLFVCQKNSRSIERSIIDIFVNEYHTNEDVAVNFINVFRKWHKGEFTDKKLDKNTLNIHIIDLLISSFVIIPPLVVPSSTQKLLEESCRCFDIVVFNDSKENFVKHLGSNGSQRFFGFSNNVVQNLTNDLLRLGKNNKLVDRFVSSLTQSDIQKICHYIYEEPIFLKFTEKSKNIIYKLSSLMPLLNNKIKFVLVGHDVDIQRFTTLKVFSTLENLSDVSEDMFQRAKKTVKIIFQGKEIFLEKLIDLHPKVSSIIKVEHLFSMAQENFTIGEKEETLPGTYLSRTVSAVYLNIETFLDYSLTRNDVVIMKCANNYETMKNLVARKGINIAEIHEFDDSHDHEIVISKNEACSTKVFHEISSKTKRKIHIIKAVDSHLCMLVLTSEDISELKHLTVDGPLITETDIHSYFNNPMNFICAQPGMGKSTMLKYLKNTCPIDYWPISVDVRQHNSFLKEKPSGAEVLQHFFEKILKNKDPLTKTLSNIFLDKKMVCLFLDGLDELDNQSLCNILDIVKEITDMGYRVWVSSRENIQKKIEDELHTFSITINEISEMQRNEYLTTRLKLKYAAEEIDAILEKISKSCNIVNNGRILGVPLQLFLLTEIFLQGEKFQGELDDNFFLLTKMYLVYFRGRWKHLLGKSECRNDHLLDELLDIKLAQYEIPALQSLFDLEFHSFNIDTNSSNTFLKSIEEKGDQLGIITKFDDAKKPVFDHVTYAEFFACRWLCKNPKEIVKLESCLFTDKYQNFKLILDTMLCEDKPLHLAVIYKNISQFERHLQDEKCVADDRMGRTPLHLACSYGTRYPTLKTDKVWHRLDNDNIDIAKEKEYQKMFQHLVQFNSTKRDKLFKWNCLDYCVASQCLLAIELLLRHEYGSKFSFTNNDRDFLDTECHYLCMKFDEIYDIDSQHELTLAYYSSKFGFEQIFFVLKYNEALPSEIHGLHFLLHLAAWGNHKQIIDYLLPLNIDINATNYNYETPLHLATKASNKDIINLLINNGASVNGSLSLLPALKYADNTEIFQLLLCRGADIHYQNYNKRNLLHFAAEEGKGEIVKMLINKGLSVNTPDVDGLTALHLAAEQGHHEIVEILLNKGAEVNAVTNKKRTPLHLAAIRGSSDVIGILVKGGVEINAQDVVGATALHLAIEFKCLEAVQILLEKGAEPNVKTNKGESSLHYAARGGNIKTIDLLIQHNGNVNAEDCQGVTPLHLAAKYRHHRAVELIFHRVDLLLNQIMESLFSETSHVTNELKQRLVSLDTPKYSKEKILRDLEARCRNDIKLYLHGNENAILLHLKTLYIEQLLRLYDNTEENYFVFTENKEMMLDFLRKKQQEEIYFYLCKDLKAAIMLWEMTYRKLMHSDIDTEGENLTYTIPLTDREAIFRHLKERLRNERKVIHGGSKIRILNHLERKHREDIELFSNDNNDGITQHLEGIFKELLGLNKNSELKEATLLYLKNKYRTEIEFLLYGNTKNKRSLLHYAAQGGNVEIIDFVLKSSIRSNTKDVDGITPLHLAVKFHHFKGVKLLLEHEAMFKRGANNEDTPLHYACKDGVLDIVRLLVKKGVCVNVSNKDDVTPLHLAVKYRRMPTINFLIKCGANVNTATTNGDTPLHYAATEGITEIVQILLDNGAEIDVANNDGLTPLHNAVKDGYLRVTAQLIDIGANVKVATKKGETLLHYASIRGHVPLMELLLYEGLDINAVDVDGITAFHLCAGQKNYEAVTLLFERKADFKAITVKKETTLHYAVRSGVNETVTRLVQMGVDINYKNENNENALFLALQEGYDVTVNFLLERGADINVVSKNGDNALHYAARSGNCAVLDVVLKNDIDINSQNEHGATPLHVAVEREHYEFVLKLLEKGANPNIKMKNGDTPLMLANSEMKTLFKKFGSQNS